MLDQIFDRVCIINLEHRVDRREETAAALAQLNCRVDGDRVRFHRAVRPDYAGEFPSIGAHGCFLSHLAILREASQDGLRSVLILEDDVYFAPHAISVLQTLSQELTDTTVGMVYGFPPRAQEDANTEGSFVVVPHDKRIMLAHMVGFFGNAIVDAGDYLEGVSSRPKGSPEGGAMHVDAAYCWFRRSRPGMKTLVAVPAIARQRASRSDIAYLDWYDRTLVIRSATAIARRIRRRVTGR